VNERNIRVGRQKRITIPVNFTKLTITCTNNLFFFTQGTGMYIYIETSSPRQLGDAARLESPWMRGQQCMTFFYHMYGATVSCVVIYIKFHATNKLKPVWLRCGDQGNHWIQGKISIGETSSYQVSCKMFVLQRLIIKRGKMIRNEIKCRAFRPANIQDIRFNFIFGHKVCKEK